MPRITVSFKNTEEDLKLHEEICKHSDKSAYIKDRLRKLKKLEEELSNIKNVETKIEVTQEEKEDDILAQLSGLGIA